MKCKNSKYNIFKAHLKYKIGGRFSYKNLHQNFIKEYQVSSIIITFDKDNEIPQVIYTTEELQGNMWGEPHWVKSNDKFYEDQLNGLLKEEPHDIKLLVNHWFGDVVYISPKREFYKTWKDYWENSGNEFGEISEITHISIEIFDQFLETSYESSNILYAEGQSNPDITNNLCWYEKDINTIKLSDININELIDIKCKEFAKPQWTVSEYFYLYDKNGNSYIDKHGKYLNNYAGFFKWLGIEDKVKENFIKELNKENE